MQTGENVIVSPHTEQEVRIRILLVEDDNDLAQRLSTGLKDAGFTVERAATGADGLIMGEIERFEAAILDLGLPELSGLEVLRQWRARKRTLPVLILTARGSWSEKVEGLNAGADDYVAKPIEMGELVARLRALIRRASGVTTSEISHNGLTLDLPAGRVSLNGTPVEVTSLELRMLNYFLHRLGRVVTQQELLDQLYTLDQPRELNTIEVYISRLRRKFGAERIKTVRGLGYRMD